MQIGTKSACDWDDKDYLLALLLICSGILLRFLFLEAKPYHHDEAIFGMYAFYQFDNPEGYYKYIPMLNGPLLFHLQSFLFEIFGATDFVGRIIPAFLGSVFIILPLTFKKIIHKNLILLIVAMMSFSPLFIYYSRFLRHEYLVISCYCLFLFFLLKKDFQWKYAIIPFLFWLQWCIKENVFVFAAIILGFAIFDSILNYKNFKKCFFNSIFPNPSLKSLNLVLIGFLAGLVTYYLLYTNYGIYYKGFEDGLFEGFKYWLNQHNVERIKGPFSIHFLMLSWYELANFLIIISALAYQISTIYSKMEKIIFYNVVLIITVISIVFSDPLLKIGFVAYDLKLKISLDIFLSLFLLFVSLWHTTILHQKKSQLHSFFFYLFVSHFFTYSYLGEKVPWLALYPLFFGFIYACHVFHTDNVFSKILDWRINNTLKASTYILIFVSIFNLYTGIRTSFFRAANIEEFIIQVHPVDNFKLAILRVIDAAKRKSNPSSTSILLLEDATWISNWYFKDSKFQIFFDKYAKPLYQHDVIFCKDPNLAILETHNRIEVDYSGWWVPDFNLMNPISFFNYSFTHKAWNVSGLMKYYIYTKKGFYEP